MRGDNQRKKSLRGNPPLFGPAQAQDDGHFFQQLRDYVNHHTYDRPLSVKAQLRAIVAGFGLSSAAAGALLLKGYQYADSKLGKGKRKSSDQPEGQKRLRYEGGTLDPHLKTVEELDAEDASEEGNRIADAVEAGIELDRQADEDEGIRNVLLGMQQRDAGTPDLVLSVEDQQEHDKSLSNLQGTEEDSEPLQYDPFQEDVNVMPFNATDDDVRMSENAGDANESGRVVSEARAAAFQPGGASLNNAVGRTTPVANIPPSFPWKNTCEAVLEHHGCVAWIGITKSGSTDAYLKIRMNTYKEPYVNSNGTIGGTGTASWTTPQGNQFGNNVIGRYLMTPGSNGGLLEKLFHRSLDPFDDRLFPNNSFNDPVVAGYEYYNAHYAAYTVTKVEWTVRIEVPFESVQGLWTTDNSPTTGNLYGNLNTANLQHSKLPPCETSIRAFTTYATSGDTISGINTPTNGHVLEMERWQNAFENKVTIPINGTRVIKGTWYPGKVNHNPLNDSDIEVWSPTGSVPGAGHLEHLVLLLRERANSNSAANTYFSANLAINLKYFVQFKDRKTEIQFPKYQQTNPAGTVVNSVVLQGPTLNAFPV